ncbi:uncharacterized protein ATNIH1004_009491 [Aspergillus tanneri]|uniref:AMP-dependent synthetase/ligase domain-containing protein n=1 Tax=Aspergillus tanneri TaxID=1220188 RepID=A0A5M9ME01_9EURO|nr:uncharacterized protein ATNIH1004_009491 [Aspergillus tanneri]KAA8642739.1 hypothetical protein ATNIH1004_009491 [Aspergillus tanneri]
MKAGGSFVLLDVSEPQDRLKNVVLHVKAEYILASARHAELAANFGFKAVLASPDAIWPLKQLAAPVPLQTDPPFYVVFTSGSAGKPSVVVTHRNFASGMHYRWNTMYIPSMQVLGFSSYSFDTSMESNLGPLMLGGFDWIASDELCMNNLVGAISTTRSNAIIIAPSSAALISPETKLGLSGSGVSLGTGRMCGYRYGQIVIGMTLQENIGSAFGVETVAELLLEGHMVGRGYVNDPEKKAAAFIENPPWLLAGGGRYPGRRGRLYKTGDLACCGTDGTPIMIGQKDTQVKIHRQRVELEEMNIMYTELFVTSPVPEPAL